MAEFQYSKTESKTFQNKREVGKVSEKELISTSQDNLLLTQFLRVGNICCHLLALSSIVLEGHQMFGEIGLFLNSL